jgi:molybdopterin molybdotransferase
VTVRRPRVHVTRGNPSIDDEADMVTPLIARAVTAVGGEVRPAPANATSAENLATALADENVDAAIVIGGTGAGRRDHSVHTLARLGRVEFHGIGVSPGETAAFGMIGARPVLLLPGRLDAALAMWLLLGRRMLARLTGLEQDESGIAVPLARKVVSTIGLAAMVPVRRTAAGLEPLASGPVALQALAQADGWILVPPENEGYAPGALVTLRPFP